MYVLAAFLVVLLMNLGAAFAVTPVSVTASGWQEPNRPRNTIDGRLDTRWSCQGECWIQYDFGEVLYTSMAAFYWLNADTRREFFKIETSVDGQTWKTVFEGESDLWPEDPEEIPIPHVHDFDDDIRYIRITGFGNSINNWNSLVDVDFIHPFDGTIDTFHRVSIVDASASDSGGANTPERAHDQFPETFWTGTQMDSYIEFELDDVYPIGRVNIAWFNGHRRVQQYAIEILLDGQEWARVLEDSSTGKTQEYETNVFPGPQLARFVRIVNNGGNNDKRALSRPKISITEVEIIAVDTLDAEFDGIATSR